MATKDKRLEGQADVIAAIEAMAEPDSSMAKKLHKIITYSAPQLIPRTWYGMPAYSNGEKIICFFRGSEKFKERYMTLGFNDSAKLDDGNMWPIVYAINKLDKQIESRISELVKKAVS